MIEIRDLSYTYPGAERPALEHVNLHIDDGEFIVIAGPSGCGKSTLALAAGGYLQHQYGGRLEGCVYVDGTAIEDQPIYETADRVGLVQQNPEAQFCTLSVMDEIAFGLENRRVPIATILERIEWALQVVQAEPLRDRALASLSGGEKQKVAIAAMLVTQPRILIFDEPTSNLDPSATSAIFDVLDRIRRDTGITIIVIEHKLAFLRSFNPRLVCLQRGQVTCDRARIPHEHDLPLGVPRSPDEVVISLEHLSYAYREGGRALDDVSLDLCAGHLIALMGDNGSGKSTFLRCAMGLLPPLAGRVLVLGQDLHQVQVSALARQVGFLFQNPDCQLLADSVRAEAVLLARNLGILAQVQERATKLLERSGLSDQLDRHPFRLSYGEKRRLNMVAVTAHAPSIVLADEILIGQDPDNAAQVMTRLRAMADSGACVVLALHDSSVALRFADRILFLESGRLTVDGPPFTALRTIVARGYGAYGIEHVV